MRIVNATLPSKELKEMAATFGNFVKAVVDIDRELLAVDADLHADLEALLLENGSRQQDLWGINLYPELNGNEFIEFDSMINIRPSQNNRSRGVQDPDIQAKIITIVNKRIQP